MAKTASQRPNVATDRCELCGASVGGARERAHHLRREHPSYARNVTARLAAPFVFLVLTAVMASLHAPTIAYLVSLAAAYALLFFGRLGSRKARAEAGAAPSIGVTRTLREGGAWIVLLVPVLALVVFLLSRLH
jgi:hypothetical protein